MMSQCSRVLSISVLKSSLDILVSPSNTKFMRHILYIYTAANTGIFSKRLAPAVMGYYTP